MINITLISIVALNINIIKFMSSDYNYNFSEIYIKSQNL